MKKNAKTKKDAMIKSNTTNVNHVNELIKPFTCNPGNLVQSQYDYSVSLNEVAAPLEFLVDQRSNINTGMHLYYDRLYSQLDRSSSIAIDSVIKYYISYIMSIFIAKLNEKLFEFTTGEQREIIIQTVCGSHKYDECSVLYDINREYNITVVQHLNHICRLCDSGSILPDDLPKYVSPNVTLFASNVIGDISNKIFDGVYLVTLQYPECVNLFEDLNTSLIDLIKDLSFNLQDLFMNLTMSLCDRLMSGIRIYNGMKRAMEEKEEEENNDFLI